MYLFFLCQVLIDEMDKNDQLIGDVYSAGDTLLQVVTSSSRAGLESELNQLEEEWAEFCQETISVKTSVEEALQSWTEYEENREKLSEWLHELEGLHKGSYNVPAELDSLKEMLERNRVMYVRESFIDFEVSIVLRLL